MKQTLTRKQEESYQCILNYTKEHGYPPTVREFGKLIGVRSTSSAFSRIKQLEQKRIYPKDSGIAKSNRDLIVRCRYE